jgi:hypothetical protein
MKRALKAQIAHMVGLLDQGSAQTLNNWSHQHYGKHMTRYWSWTEASLQESSRSCKVGEEGPYKLNAADKNYTCKLSTKITRTNIDHGNLKFFSED